MAAPFERPIQTRFNAADRAIREAYAYLKEFSSKIEEEKDNDAKVLYFTKFVMSTAKQSSYETQHALGNEGHLPKDMEDIMANIFRKNNDMMSALHKVEAVLNGVPLRIHVDIKVELEKAIHSAEILVDLWDKAYNYAAKKHQNGGVRKRTHRKTLRKHKTLRKRMHKKRTHRSRK